MSEDMSKSEVKNISEEIWIKMSENISENMSEDMSEKISQRISLLNDLFWAPGSQAPEN